MCVWLYRFQTNVHYFGGHRTSNNALERVVDFGHSLSTLDLRISLGLLREFGAYLLKDMDRERKENRKFGGKYKPALGSNPDCLIAGLIGEHVTHSTICSLAPSVSMPRSLDSDN